MKKGMKVRYTGSRKWRSNESPARHQVGPGTIGTVRDVWYDERGHYVSVEFPRRDEPIVFASRDFADGPYIDNLHVFSDQPSERTEGEQGPDELRELLSW